LRCVSPAVNKVPSLRDFARHSGERNNLAVFIFRKLKHTVNKVPSLRDFALHGREKNNLAVFIVFYFNYVIETAKQGAGTGEGLKARKSLAQGNAL
jgi:hypothetical protein